MATFVGYVDDSGDDDISLHTALLIPPEHWATSLTKWKKFRKNLHRRTEVPPEYELHAKDWIPGKGQPAAKLDAPVNTTVGIRHEWAKKALQTIAVMPGAQILTVTSHTAIKTDAYRDFLVHLDAVLDARGDHALLAVDGEPLSGDETVRRAHRDLHLPTRRIIEDGWVQNARMSQFIQMADFIVHCAFQNQVRNPDRQYMWNWYEDHLHSIECVCTCA